MKVGDIELEQGKGISFHQSSVHPDNASLADSSEKKSDLLTIVYTLSPKLSSRQFRLLALLPLLFAIICVIGSLTSTLPGWLPMIPVPGLLTLTVLLFMLSQKVQQATSQLPEDSSIMLARKARLLALLSSNKAPSQVEDMQKKLGWTETVVSTTLHALVGEKKVIEDLDLDTGHWNYTVPSDEWTLDLVDRKTLSIAERTLALQAIESQQTHAKD